MNTKRCFKRYECYQKISLEEIMQRKHYLFIHFFFFYIDHKEYIRCIDWRFHKLMFLINVNNGYDLVALDGLYINLARDYSAQFWLEKRHLDLKFPLTYSNTLFAVKGLLIFSKH